MAKAKSKAAKSKFVVLTGFEELDRQLASFPDRIRKKVVRQAMRKAMNLVMKAARANVRNKGARKKSGDAAAGEPPISRTGKLRRSIKTRAVKIKGAAVAIAVQTGEGDFKGETFYGGALEYGTSRMPPHPFMGPAADSEGDRASAVATAEIAAGIEREAPRG